MRKGLTRLGVLLIAIWVSAIIGFVAYEYKKQAPIYKVLHRSIFANDPSVEFTPNVKQRFFWKWNRAKGPSLTGNTAEYVFVPNTPLILGFLLGGPLLGWVFAFGVIWVIKGFSQHRGIDSYRKIVNKQSLNDNNLKDDSQINTPSNDLNMACEVDGPIQKQNQYLIFHCHYIELDTKLRLVELICQSEEVFHAILNKRKLSALNTWTLTEDDNKYNQKPVMWMEEGLPDGGAWVVVGRSRYAADRSRSILFVHD